MSLKTLLRRVLFVRDPKLALLGLLSMFTLSVSIFGSPALATAATDSTVNFQARLMNATGSIVPDGNYNVEFKLYSVSSGGSALWTEDYLVSATQAVHVSNGYLTTSLGSITAFPGTINWDRDLYLGINIGGTAASPTWDGEMTPRLHLTAVPYAFRAGQLATLNGANAATLSFTAPTANDTILLPDASGTVCLQTSASCGFALSSGSGSYIQNGTTSQAANFNVQAASSGSVVATLQANAAGTGDILDLKNGGGAAVATFSSTGAVLLKNSTNSTSALQIQNSTGGIILDADTSNSRIGVGTATPSEALAVVGNLQVQDAATATKSYRLRTSGSALDFEASGADLYMSVWSGANYTGTQYNQFILSASGGNINAQRGINVSGLAGQDILHLNASGGGTTDVVNSNGDLTLQGIAGSYNSFRVNNTSGVKLLGVDTNNGYVTIGNASTTVGQNLAGQLLLADGTLDGFNATVTPATLTANRTILLPDAAGTVCLQSSAACGFAPSSGSGSYIQNGVSLQTSANFNISGTGTAATSIVTPLLDTASAVALNIGTSASVINLNQNVAVASGKTLTVAGNATFNMGNTLGTSFVSDLTAGARSTPVVSITQANNASNSNTSNLLQLQNSDSSSTAAALQISQVSAGKGINLTGTTTGTVIDISGSNLTTGTGFNADGSTLTSGSLISLGGSNAGATAGFTGALLQGTMTRTLTSGSITDSGNYLNLARSNTVNNAGSTYTISGALVNLQSNCTQTAGTCTDTSNIVNINQQYANASGTVLNLQGAGTGNLAILNATNASANGVSINVQSSSSSKYVFKVTSNAGATNDLYVEADGKVGIGTATPGFALDVVGTINASTGLSVAGTTVCDTVGSTGCIAKSGSGYYIHNQTTVQAANFYVQAATSGTVTAVLQANASGTADVLDLNNGAGALLGSIGSTGAVLLQNSTDSTSALNLMTSTGGTNESVLRVDTVSERVAIGVIAGTPSAKLNIATASTVGLRVFESGAFDAFELANATSDILDVSQTGTILQKTTTNSTSALQIQGSAGVTATALDVDTTNTRVGIGASTPSRTLDVAVSNTTVNGLPLLVEQAGTGDVGLELKSASQSYYVGADTTDGKFKISSNTASGASTVFGYNTIGASTDVADQNFISAVKFTASATGTISSLNAYIASVQASPNNKGQMGIYTDSSGSPGTLLSSSADVVMTGAAWNNFPITPVSVTSGTVYWLGYNTNATSNSKNNYNYDTGVTNQFKDVSQTYGTWPSTWSGGTFDVLKPSFYANITTNTPTDDFSASLFSLGSTGQALFENSANSTSAFRIQNASANTLFNVDTTNNTTSIQAAATQTADIFQVKDSSSNLLVEVAQTGSIVLGNGGNTVTFASSTFEPTLAGNARHQKAIVLTPEYAGAVLDAANDATCSAANSGTMISSFDLTNKTNYYKWTTSSGTNQCYDVVVQMQVPSDFSAWNGAPTVSTYTSDTTNGTLKLEVRDTAGTVETNDTFASVTPTATTTWQTKTGGTLGGTYTAGSVMTLRIRMTSPTSGDVRLGNITFNYYSKY